MFHGLKGPQSGQTSRTIAEEKGDSANFVANPEADLKAAQSLPNSPGTSAQKYEERPMKPAGDSKPLDVSVPFTLTK